MGARVLNRPMRRLVGEATSDIESDPNSEYCADNDVANKTEVSKAPGAKKPRKTLGAWQRFKKSGTAKGKTNHRTDVKAKTVSKKKLHVKYPDSKLTKKRGNACLAWLNGRNDVEAFTAQGTTDHHTASGKAAIDVSDGAYAAAAQVKTSDGEIVEESRDTPVGQTVDNGNNAAKELIEGGVVGELSAEDPATRLTETQKKNDQEQQVLQPEMAIVVRGGRYVQRFNIPTGRVCENTTKTRMEDSLNANDFLFCLLDRLEWSLVADRVDDAVGVVNIIKYRGKILKGTIEGVQTKIQRSPKLREEELKHLEDKYKELVEKEEEASLQLDDYKIAQMVSSEAVVRFSRDEKQAKRNLEQARLEHERAENASTKKSLSWFPWGEVRSNLDHAEEQRTQAEAHMQATTDAKEQQMKAQADAEATYAAAKKEYKECKTQMKMVWQMLKVLKIAAAFTARACAELEIILDLRESDCSRQELKQAIKREFSKEAIGADAETKTTLALIPAPKITEYRFWATKERWQYVKEAILANPEYFE